MNTTYFARLRQLAKKDPKIMDRAVAICNGTPDIWTGRYYRKLAPDWPAVQSYKQNGDWDRFAQNYKMFKLRELDVEQVVSDLGEDAILVCWEKDASHCHRSLVAEWLREYLGRFVTELERS
jgi:uncharacterized protein YeaO (DUF488 family)